MRGDLTRRATGLSAACVSVWQAAAPGGIGSLSTSGVWRQGMLMVVANRESLALGLNMRHVSWVLHDWTDRRDQFVGSQRARCRHFLVGVRWGSVFDISPLQERGSARDGVGVSGCSPTSSSMPWRDASLGTPDAAQSCDRLGRPCGPW